MKRTMPLAMAAALALAIAGCGFQSDAELTATAAAAREKAKPTWKLQLETPTGMTNATLERMDIFLTEDEANESEIFEIHGPVSYTHLTLPTILRV